MVQAVCSLFQNVSNKDSSSLPLVIGNPADTLHTSSGPVTLYIPEFSKPTGRYINKILLRALNRLMRSGSLAIAGNPCTPGLGIIDAFTAETAGDILEKSPRRTVMVNCRKIVGNPPGIAFKAEPFMQLSIRTGWKSINDCLYDMHSKYRVRAKKALTESAVLQSQIFRGRGIPSDYFPVMAHLLSQTLSQKTIALPPNLTHLLKSFANQFGQDFEVQIYHHNNNPVGFLSRIYLPSGVYGMHIGYNSQNAKQWHIYQRMMIDLIDQAIAAGATKVNLGRTATEIKSTLGAVPEENYFVLLSRNPFIRFAAKTYKKLFFKPGSYIIRKPFKD